MKTPSSLSEAPPSRRRVVENGWYLLRAGIAVRNVHYRAGTPVEHVDGEWFLQGPLDQREKVSLRDEMVCRTHYDGVSLCELERVENGELLARPVLSTLSPLTVDPQVVQFPLRVGESRVCVRFGHCFLPLEFFNW